MKNAAKRVPLRRVTEIAPSNHGGAVLIMYTAVLTTAGFIAPAAMGYSLQNAFTAAAGFRESFIVVGVVTLIGVRWINPKADREPLAKWASEESAATV